MSHENPEGRACWRPLAWRAGRRRRRWRRTSSACLITKTETNPFFVKMREGAQAKADELGVKLTALAGRDDGDNEGQVAAIETCIADGVNGHPAGAAPTARRSSTPSSWRATTASW